MSAIPRDGLSFTGFKRDLKVGAQVQITNHRYPNLSRRERLVRVQTNAIAAPATRADGVRVEASWIYWPKATFVRMEGHTCHLLDETTGEPWLSIERLF